MTLIATTVDTPLGAMSLVGTGDCLFAAGFGDDPDTLRPRLAPEIRAQAFRSGDSPAAAALRDYFAGDVAALDRVDVSQPGGAFHSTAWKEMRAIAPGTTVSYSELAARSGVARNAVCLFVPCHRVVRSDGTLGGYYYGLATKSRLLEHERVTDR
jgi:methylated-DNA-[protein]-cysteine S-methyltransferase